MVLLNIAELYEQNGWWTNKNVILEDAKIKELENQEYVWPYVIKKYLVLDVDVIQTIRGSRQLGKTTFIKTVIKKLLLEDRVNPKNIFFWSIEKNNANELHDILKTYLDSRKLSSKRKYIFIDEICSIKDWSKIILYFANAGYLVNCSLFLTGSHAIDLKRESERLPGRRGGHGNSLLNIIVSPKSFLEFVNVIYPHIKKRLFELKLDKEEAEKKIYALFNGNIDESIVQLSFNLREINAMFDQYLLLGGFPKIINEYYNRKKIDTKYYNLYISAMLSDLIKWRYKEPYFKQLMSEIIRTFTTPITWNELKKGTDIKSNNTVQDYASAFEELYLANIVYKLDQKRRHSDRKKVYFLDPFLFHLLNGWINNEDDYFISSKEALFNSEIKSKIVESVVYSHLIKFTFNRRPDDFFDPKNNVFFFKNRKGKEIDFVMYFADKTYPIEVKYQTKIVNSDFFNFRSFNKGVLLTSNELGTYRNYVKIPVSLFLLLI